MPSLMSSAYAYLFGGNRKNTNTQSPSNTNYPYVYLDGTESGWAFVDIKGDDRNKPGSK